jgi:hypothetical protein
MSTSGGERMKTTQRTHIGKFIPAAAAATVLVLTACGPRGQATPQSTSSNRPAASPSASAASQPILVVAGPDVNATAPVITLYRPDGTEVNHFEFSQGSWPLAAAGDRIFIKSGDKLQALKRDGSVETLVSPFTGRGLLTNADGTKWIWSTYSSSGDNVHSQVYLAGDGLQPRVIEDVTEAHRSLAPMSWTAQGVFISHRPLGIGGYIPFSPAFGPVDRLDPNTWKATADPRTSACAFSDSASDGTIACFTVARTGSSHQLALIRSDGSKLTIELPSPQFRLSGDAYFDPAGSRVTVAGAVGDAPANEQFTTDLVAKSDASLNPAPIIGVRPAMGRQSWLPDGSLVLWRPAHAAGGDPGLYIIDPTGHQTFIPVSGEPVGYLAS